MKYGCFTLCCIVVRVMVRRFVVVLVFLYICLSQDTEQCLGCNLSSYGQISP